MYGLVYVFYAVFMELNMMIETLILCGIATCVFPCSLGQVHVQGVYMVYHKHEYLQVVYMVYHKHESQTISNI